MTRAVLNSCFVIAASAAVLLGVFHPRVVNSVTWRATVTPLASIIGSGFLVLCAHPDEQFRCLGFSGYAVLCTLAYLIGGAIRFNIDCYRIAREGNLSSSKSRV